MTNKQKRLQSNHQHSIPYYVGSIFGSFGLVGWRTLFPMMKRIFLKSFQTTKSSIKLYCTKERWSSDSETLKNTNMDCWMKMLVMTGAVWRCKQHRPSESETPTVGSTKHTHNCNLPPMRYYAKASTDLQSKTRWEGKKSKCFIPQIKSSNRQSQICAHKLKAFKDSRTIAFDWSTRQTKQRKSESESERNFL